MRGWPIGIGVALAVASSACAVLLGIEDPVLHPAAGTDGSSVDAGDLPPAVEGCVSSPACDSVVDPSSGVFVDPAGGDGASCGTADAPCRSIQSAIDRAGSRAVFLARGEYTESIRLARGTVIVGAFERSAGSWTRRCTPGLVTLTASMISDVTIVAADVGESSIDSVVVRSSSVIGASQSVDGIRVSGATSSLCLGNVVVATAAGGNGSDGRIGAPGVAPSCTTGGSGAAGAAGESGMPAAIDAVSLAASSASDGTPGATGENGGFVAATCTGPCANACAVSGGQCAPVNGAAMACPVGAVVPCGGGGGGGGGAGGNGGSSVALRVVDGATVHVKGGRLTAGNGGNGGRGGDGGVGSAGVTGDPGKCQECLPNAAVCAPSIDPPLTDGGAGTGGMGGPGGTGGGGAPGFSCAIFTSGDGAVLYAPAVTPLQSGSPGVPGAPNGPAILQKPVGCL